jgi:DUF4097 and DUF4098 domain-containing protein YvlB
MPRALLIAATLATVLTATGAAQTRDRGRGRSDTTTCADYGGSDRASYCEVREETIGGANPLDVNAGQNGGIRIHGWDRGDVRVRARIVGYADTDAEARRVVSGIRIDTAGGSVSATGPDGDRDSRWSVTFDLQVPRTALLTLTTHNGGIGIDGFRGTAKFQAENGGVTLRDVSGDIRGGTTNGGVTVDLTGDHWDGTGLDVETRNGGIRLNLPENYSADLETSTTNGRLNVDFPITVPGTIGRSLATTLGAGGAKLRAITTNGGVSIRRR